VTADAPRVSPAVAAALRRASRAAAILVAGIGAFVLIAWIVDLPAVTGLRPWWVTMKANSAMCFVLIAAALLLSEGANRDRVRVARVLAATVLVIGAATLA
jgi:hypothetical protein